MPVGNRNQRNVHNSTQDIQMMKKKMDVTMNAIKEQMSTNLDELV